MNVEDPRITPVTPGQRVVWRGERAGGGNGMMGVPLLYRLHGDLVVSDLAAALDNLMSRHAALRTTFVLMSRKLNQITHPPGHVPLELTRIDTTSAQDPVKEAYGQVRDWLRAGTDISVAPLRAALWHMADDDHLLVLDIHHIVTDAWSNMIISRDLAALYRAQRQGCEADLPEIKWQYADYASWRQQNAASDDVHREYVIDLLRGAQFLKLPPAPERPGRQRPLAGNEWFDLDPEQIEALRTIARDERTTLFVVMMSLFFAAMHSVTGQPDIAMGSVFANRGRPEVRESVGFFANMVVVRARLGTEPTIRDVIRVIRHSVLDCLAHEEFSHVALPHDAWPPDASGQPEDVVFHMLAEPPTARVEGRTDFGGLRVQQHHIPDGLGSRFELEMLAIPRPNGLECVIRYAADRFTREYAEDIAGRFLAAVSELTAGHLRDPAPSRSSGAAQSPAGMTRIS
jgi:hypothetical protein